MFVSMTLLVFYMSVLTNMLLYVCLEVFSIVTGNVCWLIIVSCDSMLVICYDFVHLHVQACVSLCVFVFGMGH